MPTYEYVCQQCGIHFDRRQSFNDAPVAECPECSGSTRRVLTAVPVIFKGKGFYSTDNSRSGGWDGSTDSTETDSSGSQGEDSTTAPAVDSGSVEGEKSP